MPGLGFVLGGPRVDPWGGCTFFFPFYLSIFDDDSGAGILEFSCTFRTVVLPKTVCYVCVLGTRLHVTQSEVGDYKPDLGHQVLEATTTSSS